jgi:hypothetical protein
VCSRDLRCGGRAGDADLMLIDDGGAADQHDGIGVAAAGIDAVPEDRSRRLGAVRGGGIVSRVFARGGDLAQNGAGLEVGSCRESGGNSRAA